MEDHGKSLPKDVAEEVKTALDDLVQKMESSDDPEELNEAYEKLDKVSMKIGEFVYQQGQSGGNDEDQQQEQ